MKQKILSAVNNLIKSFQEKPSKFLSEEDVRCYLYRLLFARLPKEYSIYAQHSGKFDKGVTLLKGNLRFIDLTIIDNKNDHLLDIEIKKSDNKNGIHTDLNKLKKLTSKYRLMLVFIDKGISPNSYSAFDKHTKQEYKSFQKTQGLLFVINYPNHSVKVINNWR